MLRHSYRRGLARTQALLERLRPVLRNRKVRRAARTLLSAVLGPLLGSLISRGCVALPEALRPTCQAIGSAVGKVIGVFL